MEVMMFVTKMIRLQREGVFEAKTQSEVNESNVEFIVEEKDENGDVSNKETTVDFETITWTLKKNLLLETAGNAIVLQKGDLMRVDMKNAAGLGVSLIKSKIPDGVQGRQTEMDFRTIKKMHPY